MRICAIASIPPTGNNFNRHAHRTPTAGARPRAHGDAPTSSSWSAAPWACSASSPDSSRAAWARRCCWCSWCSACWPARTARAASLYDDFSSAYLIGSVALAVILFEGGLKTPLSHAAAGRLAGARPGGGRRRHHRCVVAATVMVSAACRSPAPCCSAPRWRRPMPPRSARCSARPPGAAGAGHRAAGGGIRA